MEYPKVFTSIYLVEPVGTITRGLHLVFYNANNKSAVLFDGVEFAYNLNVVIAEETVKELEYSMNNKGDLVVSTIRHDWDVFFIVFENGDIFHIYYMMNDEDSPQRLDIYRKGRPEYDWAKNKYDKYEEPEFEQDSSIDVNVWFNRYSKDNK